jgi:hypothetical protein
MTPEMTDGTRCWKALIKQQSNNLDAEVRLVALLLFCPAMAHSCMRRK